MPARTLTQVHSSALESVPSPPATDAPGPSAAAKTPSGRATALVLTGLLLTLLLAALDSTIVATAMPRIIGDLGGLDRYTWVVTAYLLTSTVAVPIVGKLADQFGRRPFLIGGTVFFLLTSLLCSAATSLEQLVAFRALQGVGGGVITAAVFAAVPSLFSATARARIVGLFTATYGLASIVGPLLGGVVTDTVGWRGIFALNLPIGLVALAILVARYPGRSPNHVRPVVDYLGAVFLVAGIGPLFVTLSLGGHGLAWDSPLTALLLALSGLLLAAFLKVERGAKEPIVPLGLLGSRAVGIPTLGMACMAAGLFATSLFTPLFLQGVNGQSATGSGSVLAPMMLAWVVASILIGQLIARLGRTRPTALAGMATATFGLWLMAGMGPGTEYAIVARNLVIVGLGLGSALASFAVAAQNAVPTHQTGVATALGTFARSMGGTLASAGLDSLLAAQLGTAAGVASVRPPVLGEALHTTFLAAATVVALGMLATLWMREVPANVSAARRSRGSSARLPGGVE